MKTQDISLSDIYRKNHCTLTVQKTLITLLLLLIIPCLAFSETLPCTGTTKTSNLNVRKSTASTSDRVMVIKEKGTIVTVLREEINRKGNIWYYIQVSNGRKGYVQAEYIELETQSDHQGSHTVTFKLAHTGGDTYNDVGEKWTFYYEINGKQIDRKSGVSDFISGEEYIFYTRVREQDSIPDTGTDTVSYVPTIDDIAKGFTVEQKIRVEENSGPFRGKSVVWTVIWLIEPVPVSLQPGYKLQ